MCKPECVVRAVRWEWNTPPAVHGPGKRLGVPCRVKGAYLTVVSFTAHHSSMWHNVVPHRVTSHSGWGRKQGAPVPKMTGGPPVWRHIVLPIRIQAHRPAYLHPPPHSVCANYGYDFRFNNPADPIALRNVIIIARITITRNNFTTIIHTPKPTRTKKLHSCFGKVGVDIKQTMHLLTKIRGFYMHLPSRATSFKG